MDKLEMILNYCEFYKVDCQLKKEEGMFSIIIDATTFNSGTLPKLIDLVVHELKERSKTRKNYVDEEIAIIEEIING